MRSILCAAALVAALAGPAAAGPGSVYTFICKPEVHVLGGAPQMRFIHPQISGLARDPDDVYGSQCIQGCYVEPLRLVPDGALEKGHRYLALLAPAGGAACSTTAQVLVAIPIDPLDALGALLGVA